MNKIVGILVTILVFFAQGAIAQRVIGVEPVTQPKTIKVVEVHGDNNNFKKTDKKSDKKAGKKQYKKATVYEGQVYLLESGQERELQRMRDNDRPQGLINTIVENRRRFGPRIQYIYNGQPVWLPRVWHMNNLGQQVWWNPQVPLLNNRSWWINGVGGGRFSVGLNWQRNGWFGNLSPWGANFGWQSNRSFGNFSWQGNRGFGRLYPPGNNFLQNQQCRPQWNPRPPQQWNPRPQPRPHPSTPPRPNPGGPRSGWGVPTGKLFIEIPLWDLAAIEPESIEWIQVSFFTNEHAILIFI